MIIVHVGTTDTKEGGLSMTFLHVRDLVIEVKREVFLTQAKKGDEQYWRPAARWVGKEERNS